MCAKTAFVKISEYKSDPIFMNAFPKPQNVFENLVFLQLEQDFRISGNSRIFSVFSTRFFGHFQNSPANGVFFLKTQLLIDDFESLGL